MASTVELVLPAKAVGDYHQYSNPDGLVGQFNYFDQNGTKNTALNGRSSDFFLLLFPFQQKKYVKNTNIVDSKVKLPLNSPTV
jgi:hypothetical protein